MYTEKLRGYNYEQIANIVLEYKVFIDGTVVYEFFSINTDGSFCSGLDSGRCESIGEAFKHFREIADERGLTAEPMVTI